MSKVLYLCVRLFLHPSLLKKFFFSRMKQKGKGRIFSESVTNGMRSILKGFVGNECPNGVKCSPECVPPPEKENPWRRPEKLGIKSLVFDANRFPNGAAAVCAHLNVALPET